MLEVHSFSLMAPQGLGYHAVMDAGGTAETKHGLKRISPLWALAAIPVTPLVFPPVVIFYFGFFNTWSGDEPLWIPVACLASIGFFTRLVDRETRGRLADNVIRTQSALSAREDAALGLEPAALILRAFMSDVAYSDSSAAFTLLELIDPALREAGYRPLALGRNLPLPPRHGTAFIETGEETWWQVFTEVAAAAAVIIVFPQDTPSLRRELAWLSAREMLDKVALLMAPQSLDIVYYGTSDGGASGPAADDANRKEGWREVRRIWSEDLGVELPDYDAHGALILFNPDRAVSVRSLRTEIEKPTWLGWEMMRNYRERYGVDFEAIWRAAVQQRGWDGPPVCDLWRRLAPAPLHIDYRAYFRPPGATGMEWRELKMTAAVGWSCVLATLLVAAVGLLWKLF